MSRYKINRDILYQQGAQAGPASCICIVPPILAWGIHAFQNLLVPTYISPPPPLHQNSSYIYGFIDLCYVPACRLQSR